MNKKTESIGERIRRKREERGMTQEELAYRMGYRTKSTINKIENGVNDVTQSKIVKFATVLNTTIAYLMGYEESSTKTADELKREEIENLMYEFADFTAVDFENLRLYAHTVKKVKTQYGNVIKQAREKRNMTQEKLAKLLKVSLESVQAFEDNKIFPVEHLINLYKYLNITYADLLGLENYYSKLFGKIYDLHLQEEELKELLNYAKYLKSKRK